MDAVVRVPSRSRYDEDLLRAVVSGLGSSQEDGRGRVKYVRGYDCEGCLDDLRRLLHRDDPMERRYFRTLGLWDVVRGELAPLLCSCPGETTLVFKICTLCVSASRAPSPHVHVHCRRVLCLNGRIRIRKRFPAVLCSSDV